MPKEARLTLGLEPINRYETFLLNNVDQANQFVQKVGPDSLRIHLDTFHMNLEESALVDAVRKAGRLLINMHVSDSNREAPGRGHIDFARLLGALRDMDDGGFLTLEPVPAGSDPLLASRMSKNNDLRDIYARESIDYLKRLEEDLPRA